MNNSGKELKLLLYKNGGHIFQKCPNCNKAFSVSLWDTGIICTPSWCETKDEPFNRKKANAMVEKAQMVAGDDFKEPFYYYE